MLCAVLRVVLGVLLGVVLGVFICVVLGVVLVELRTIVWSVLISLTLHTGATNLRNPPCYVQ